MANETNKTSLTFKEIIAISLSIAAFILSIVNFYYANYKVNDNLTARVIDIKSKSTDTLSVNVIFINKGNRQAVILKPLFQIADSINPRKGTWKDVVTIRNENNFPFVIQPHEMKIINIEFATIDVVKRPGKVSKDDKTINDYKLGLIYFSLDSEAKQHIAWSDFNISISTKFGHVGSYAINENLNSLKYTELFDK